MSQTQIQGRVTFVNNLSSTNHTQINKTTVKVKPEINVLKPLELTDLPDIKEKDSNSLDPKLIFSHDFISGEINEFGLHNNFCQKCNPLLSHFANLESAHDAIYRNHVSW